MVRALLPALGELGQIIVISEGERPVFIGTALAQATGYSMRELRRLTSLYALVPPDEKHGIDQRYRAQVEHFETRIARKDGGLIDLEVSEMPIRLGKRDLTLTLARDITERRQVRKALEHQALHDSLTGLPNRVLLHDRLEQAIRLARRENSALALMILDLDHFKEVNDSYGHQAGDKLLQLVGRRLTGTLRETDTVARLGGDEYAVVLLGADERAARRVAEKLLKTLESPFEVQGQALDVGASIGIATYPLHAEILDGLMRRADIALYVAKRSRRAYAFYAAEHEQSGTGRLALMAQLRRGIANGELRVHYQPIVAIPSGEVIRMEALVRWQHPERGLVPPDEFISVAEQTGLIQPLTHWVLRRALQDCLRWHERGVAITVAVNVSMRNLLDPELPALIADMLARVGADPSWLRLEVTENVIMADPGRNTTTLEALRALGVGLSVDDFGTGYSSLAYLHRLPVDEIKIDKSFVKPMATDRDTRAIVRAAVYLAHSLRLHSVAEGIEDADTFNLLATLGCDAGQGYYIARPMPESDVIRWLLAR